MANEASLAERFNDMLKDRVVPEIGAELKRLGVQGQMELASALFNGNLALCHMGRGSTPRARSMTRSRNLRFPDAQQEQQHRGRSM